MQISGMQNHLSFTIYNASAGSGKTYTLVKDYLKILFKSEKKEPFKHVLAITFTNKAVNEMKARIIEALKQFSEDAILKEPTGMFNDLCEELSTDAITLHQKSKKLLEAIIHNYAAFDVSTIDAFTHKLIRTFAYDLKLPLNFEVELDQEALLNEAVDRLISKAGTDKTLTKTLVDFAIEKADDDKSWDVSYDFNKIANLLINENDIPFIETLKNKSIEDFNALKSLLKKQLRETECHIVEKAESMLTLIEQAGLEFNDFSRGTLPNHFKKASELNLGDLYNNKLEENINQQTGIYTKSLSVDKAHIIDSLLPDIETAYKTIKKAVFHLKFLKAFYKNITPLSVLNAINKELKTLKDEQSKMLISEFNTIISNEIKNQPTPFIYERIGEKFKHYFIDEFQDTSVLQWENLIPLVDNALSSEYGSAMLVGDAKQAIYRWRGGKAEQFINLFNKQTNPFQIEQYVANLPTNYRSFKEIVNFNNGFFKFLSNKVFGDTTYETLYEKSHQNNAFEQEGYVNLSFLEIGKEDDRDDRYASKVLATINFCLENGFAFEDICVLVRKKKEGVFIANYLSQYEIPVISSETLLLYNAPEVTFINNMLALLIQPQNDKIKVSVLNYIMEHFNIEDKHAFLSKHIRLTIPELFKSFESLNVFVDSSALLQQSLYDITEMLVRCFNLVKGSNAYIQFYLDVVLDYSQKKGSDIPGFLDHFEKKKDSLSIVSPQGQNAVQIMTIHKAKGLEFPVVIFPYADLDIYREKDPYEWFPLEKETYHGFSHTLLNYTKDFEYFGEEGLSIFNAHQSEQELDNMNLLYVTLTRAIEQLYVISQKEFSTKGEPNNKKYSGLFINYLIHLGRWNDSDLEYSFGNPKKTSDKKGARNIILQELSFISTAKEDHNINIVTSSGYLWDTRQQDAIEKGNLIHDMMSKIKTKEDVDFVINDFEESSIINKEQVSTLKETIIAIIEHPKLEMYFSPEYTIYNERDIITEQGEILRPDRVVVNEKHEAFVIDYKTGQEDKKHIEQLTTYHTVLESIGLKVIKKFLVYINDVIQIKEV